MLTFLKNSVGKNRIFYLGNSAEVHISFLLCRCHSNSTGSGFHEVLFPMILRSGEKLWFVVPDTDLWKKMFSWMRKKKEKHKAHYDFLG